jgi:flagellar biosynthesis protein FliR
MDGGTNDAIRDFADPHNTQPRLAKKMGGNDLEIWVTSCVLLSLRITPVFLFAPPFTLTRVPKLFTALMGMGLSAILVSAYPDVALVKDVSAPTLLIGGVRELFLGLLPVVVLQLMFGGLYITGRTIDIQAGFGLALIIDPTTRGQTPLMGTLFAYLAGATFFAMNGHLDLLRFFAASLEAVPLGSANELAPLSRLTSYIFVVSMIALGVGGAAILALFLTDIVIAMLTRTVPQMNALLLGIQVKAVIMLAVMPVAIGVAGALLVRLVANALNTMPKLL